MRKTLLPLLAAIVLANAAFAGEQADKNDNTAALAELVRRQGAEIAELRQEVRTLRTRDTTDLDVAVTEYLAETGEQDPARTGSYRVPVLFGGRVRVGGYFSLEFRDDGDDANMEFDQHRLILKLQAEIAAGLSFETEIEIEGGGADVDFLTGNEILVEYAELRYELVEDMLTFKAGAVLIPWGRFNRFHDDPLNDLTDRPVVSRRLAAVAFDQAGIGAEGTFGIGDGWFLDYDLVLAQGFDDDISTNGGIRGARQSFREDNNNNKAVFLRLVLDIPAPFVDGLHVGVSGNTGKYDDAGQLRLYGYAFEIFVKKGPFEFVAEYMNVRIEQPGGAPLSDPRRMDGWYVELSYHFFPERWRGAHTLFGQESTFTFVVRVEAVDLNHSTDGSTFRDDLEQITFGINFRPVERSVFKISYTIVESDEAGFDSGSADRFVISWASYF